MEEEQLMVWSTEEQNNLPDSCFMYIAPGGKKDEDGKTVPRELRKLPYKNKDGNVDENHLRNAISRLSQEKTDIPEDTKKSLLEKARKMLENMKNKESHSAEEEVKMDEIKEVLTQEPTQVVALVEGVAQTESLSVEKKEEKLEQTTVTETIKPVEIVQTQEVLQKDIKETKEELAVIREVRDELVALYARYKDKESNIERLTKEVTELSSKNKEMSEQLGRYVAAEERLNSEKRIKRIEQLSAKFKLLGQNKTVEQLSLKDEETLIEFENIVTAALERAGETKEMPEVTEPSQGTANKQVEHLSNEGAKPVVKKVNQNEQLSFFSNICKELTKEQSISHRGSRAKLM